MKISGFSRTSTLPSPTTILFRSSSRSPVVPHSCNSSLKKAATNFTNKTTSLAGSELAQDPQEEATFSGPNQAADPQSECDVSQDMPHMMVVGPREGEFR